MLILAQDSVNNADLFQESFYFFTVAIMWLLHVGFMTYEAGVARRKNLMSTAMKNIMTIAVVTPTFYYLGWWMYFCFEEGLLPTTEAGVGGYFCGDGYGLPWEGSMGPNLIDNLTGVFWAAFVLFSWTTGSIMSGAILERVRVTGYLWLTAFMGGIVWVVAGGVGLELRRLAHHPLRLPRLRRFGRRPRGGRYLRPGGAAQPRSPHRSLRP